MSVDTIEQAVSETDLDQQACCTLRRIAGGRPLCQRPAAWAVRLGCCGHVKVVCHKHRDLPSFPALHRFRFRCAGCGCSTPPVTAIWPI